MTIRSVAELQAAAKAIRGRRAFALAAGLSESWLWQFAHGRIPNPGSRTLEKLEQALGDGEGVSVRHTEVSRSG